MSTTLNNKLWESADILREKMDAGEYKNYLLGLIFYKYLSDVELREVYEQENGKTIEFPEREEQFKILKDWYEEDKKNLEKIMRIQCGYFIAPEQLFYRFRQKADTYEFRLTDLQTGFNDLERQGEQFSDLFTDIDLNSTKLGPNDQKRNVAITEVIKALDELDFFEPNGDAIGDAYEYLIGQFAIEAGKKGNEFYTPQAISRIISEITSIGQEDRVPFHIYDPMMGSGTLLLNIRNYVQDKNKIHYYGQELNTTALNLARMNLILHGVDKGRMHLKLEDVLDIDWSTEESHQFDTVVMSHPYSIKWSAPINFLTDARFERYGKLAPKSKAELALLLHGFYHLKDGGTMGIVLPQGVLFRGAAEGVIRKALLEMGAIDAVIGLPENIFYGTSISTTVIILKKNRDNRDVLFIDASNDFEKQKKQNMLRESDIEKIIETYKAREDVEKYAHLASFKEMESNDFNLNIPRYVDTFEEEQPIDVVALSKEIVELNQEISKTEQEFLSTLNQLAVMDDSCEIIEATKILLSSK